MEQISKMTENDILSADTLTEVFDIEDELERAQVLALMGRRAKNLKCKSEFAGMVNAFRKKDRETAKKNARKIQSISGVTDFPDCPYEQMRCGAWIARNDKIYKENPFGYTDYLACYHPILPVGRLKNLETGFEQIKLAYKRNGVWRDIIVPKDVVASASKIVTLSKLGVSVTSENAKHLVQYLADVENLNDDFIAVDYSSSKLGWIGKGFLPYDSDITFDGDVRFRQIYESIASCGEREAWYDHVKDLRASGHIEINLMLAASFASVLVKPLQVLPFIVDLWGETEGGKSVTLMLAASVWANPAENQYIGDFKTTDVALEARADMLNNLPMILDDTSKTSARIRDNFEGMVYDLCSGKGKSRSNRDLGINRENHWESCILTNGERPLSSYVEQGGAINRILEVECGEKVYNAPQHTVDVLKSNFGFAGRDFIDAIKNAGTERLRAIQRDFQKLLYSDGKMQKQSISLSVILTADKIATDYLFADGQYIPINVAKNVLVDKNELSDNERAYRFIMDKIAMNELHFDGETKTEQWGIIERDEAIIFGAAFDKICEEGRFSKKAFLSWADKKRLIRTNNAKRTMQKWINGKNLRCVCIKLDGNKEKESPFLPIDETVQLELPFD